MQELKMHQPGLIHCIYTPLHYLNQLAAFFKILKSLDFLTATLYEAIEVS